MELKQAFIARQSGTLVGENGNTVTLRCGRQITVEVGNRTYTAHLGNGTYHTSWEDQYGQCIGWGTLERRIDAHLS